MNSSRLSAHTPAVPTLARRPLSNRLALALGLLALGGCSAFQPPASAAVNAPHVTAKAGPDSQAPHSPTKPGNQATGNSPSPGSLATQEQATGGGKKEAKKDSQETKGSKSSKGSGRGKALAGRDVAASPESGVDDEARAAVRGALAQIAAAAEQAHKDSQQEGQDPHEDQGAVEAPEAGVSDTADAATQTAENGQSSDGQEVSDSPAEDKPVKTRSRKAADKKSAKKTGEKKGDKADKKSGRKTGKKAEKKAATTSEDPVEPQPGEAPAEPVEEKPVRRTRRRATAKSAAPSPENSSDAPEASA